jgi:phosphate-selective porin OprO/OprP
LTGAALGVLAPPALAQTDPRVTILEQQLRDVRADLDSLKKAQDNASKAASQTADLGKQIAAQPKVTNPNGRFTFTSADGDFSVSLRALVQFDMGYFSQGRNPASVDLNSGTNFRRAQLGFQGTVFRDWAYNFIYDFGGYGAEGRGYIYNAYIEYDGLKPFAFRVGAYTPPEGLEDQTSSGELFFPERAASVDVARGIAGAPSREAASIIAQGDNYLLSLSYTGKKTGDATSTGPAIGTFDSQQALVGRAAWLAVNSPDFKWLVEGHITDVLKLADTAAGSGATAIRLSNGSEVAVDASKTIDTGSIDADAVREFGFESGGAFDRFYGQGGWYRYEVERRTALPSPHFSGWYALLAFSLTGEQHPYDPATATFRNLRPSAPLGPKGWGAWEVAARYSDIDLDFMPLTAAASGGIAGGKQDVWTLGLNWYPNNAVKFQLNYDNLQVAHPNAPANDISASAIVLRSQIAL